LSHDDEQSAVEGTLSIIASLLAGNNLTHDVGYLESGPGRRREEVAP